MRALFFGQTGPFAAAALHVLTASASAAAAPGLRLVGVVEGAGVKVEPHRRNFFGLADIFGAPAPKNSGLDLEAHAAAMGVPHLWWGRPEPPRALHGLIERTAAEVAICVGFPFVWPSSLLARFERALNVHPSLLPRWRGPAPLFWWLRSGEAATGVTVHEMAAVADSGPICAQAPLAPPWRCDGAALLALSGRLGARLLQRVLCGQADTVRRRQPSEVMEPHAPRPRPEDGFFTPQHWTPEALLRFAHGAPYFCTPSLLLAESRHFVRGGVGRLDVPRLPGEFVRENDVVWVQAHGGVVGLRVQS